MVNIRSTGASSTGVESSKPDSESDSDDDTIGPRPPRPGETLSSLQAQVGLGWDWVINNTLLKLT